MNDEKETRDDSITENLSAVGQMIIGTVESVGGVLMGDPMTRAEGDFNTNAGALHQESNRVLTAIDEREDETKINDEETK
jgi:hypothetical protein